MGFMNGGQAIRLCGSMVSTRLEVRRGSTNHGRRKQRLSPLLVCEEKDRSPLGRRRKGWIPQMENVSWAILGGVKERCLSEEDVNDERPRFSGEHQQ